MRASWRSVSACPSIRSSREADPGQASLSLPQNFATTELRDTNQDPRSIRRKNAIPASGASPDVGMHALASLDRRTSGPETNSPPPVPHAPKPVVDVPVARFVPVMERSPHGIPIVVPGPAAEHRVAERLHCTSTVPGKNFPALAWQAPFLHVLFQLDRATVPEKREKDKRIKGNPARTETRGWRHGSLHLPNC
jgi:hypothetical protein